MSQSSSDPLATARNAQAALLQRLREISQTEAARQLGVDKSTINRLVNAHAEALLGLLAVAGLQVVDSRARFIDDEDLQALRRLASHGLNHVATGGADA
jgi:transcriptional regulator with XRE-family HTH domain